MGSFRIGCIGQMDEKVMQAVVRAVQQSLTEMGVGDASPTREALTERSRLLAEIENV